LLCVIAAARQRGGYATLWIPSSAGWHGATCLVLVDGVKDVDFL
jgi:hypothetical protein